ncbi:MAG: hypothetical protein JXB39_08300 [Deltaproteobacteria bacterium]|nr:hypothetical protein [Deltaproteobacteria bacterium]
MSLWHLTLATEGRQALFPDEAARRAAVRALASVARERLVLFSVVDDHVHLVTLGDRPGHLGRSVRLVLRPHALVPPEAARVRPVEGRSHLESLVRYLLGQPVHHGIPVHPALWTGSCFLDLAGARLLPGFRDRLPELLPRLPRSAVFRAVGLPPDAVRPADDACIRTLGPARLHAAATAVVGLGPVLSGRAADVVAVRAAASALARGAGIATAESAHAFGLPLRTVQRLARSSIDPALSEAIRRRLTLEESVAALPSGPYRTPETPPSLAGESDPP